MRRDIKLTKNRIEILDLFRGYVIFLMLFIHIVGILDHKFKGYHYINLVMVNMDIAIEGFLVLAGIMVGMHYYKKYQKKPKEVIIRILSRAGQIVILQYILIFTVSIPLYYFIYGQKNMLGFLIRSLLFLNQLGIFHILPVFIPMFLISPVVLFCFKKRMDSILLLSSIILFIVGINKPYILNIGDKTIFPFITYQFYFVIGCFFGKLILRYNNVIPNNINKLCLASVLFLITMIFAKHGHHVFPFLLDLRSKYGITFSKFPLNLSGFFYQISILFFLYTIVAKYWDLIKRTKISTPLLMLLGRHALLVFILHVYTYAFIETVTHFYNNEIVTLFTVFITFIFIIVFTMRLSDNSRLQKKMPLKIEAG